MSRRNSDSEFDSEEELIRLLQWRKPKPSMQGKPKPSMQGKPRHEPRHEPRPIDWKSADDLFDDTTDMVVPKPDQLVAFGRWLRSHTVFTTIRRKVLRTQRLTRKERSFKFSSLCALWIIDRLSTFEDLPAIVVDTFSDSPDLESFLAICREVLFMAYISLFQFVRTMVEERDFMTNIKVLNRVSSLFEEFLDIYETFQPVVPRHGVPELPEDFTF